MAPPPAAVVGEGSYSVMSDWFFQMVFVATTASIVSGALAERAKMWTFFLFTLLLTALIYPIVGAWTWEAMLDQMGFQDFAGSTIVHSTGGWAALAGILVVGPRLGKFRRDGTVRPTPPSNVLVVTLGVFILWFGWFGFNGGSQLALGSVARRDKHEQRAGQHEPCGRSRHPDCTSHFAADPWPHRPVRGTERRHCRTGLNYSRARHPRRLLGGHHRRHRRRPLHRRNQTPGDSQGWTT